METRIDDSRAEARVWVDRAAFEDENLEQTLQAEFDDAREQLLKVIRKAEDDEGEE